MSLFSTVKVESLTSVVATPDRGGERGLQGAGVNGETEHWPEREDTGGGAAALSTPAPSQRGDKCI